jgi:hypothetical protein
MKRREYHCKGNLTYMTKGHKKKEKRKKKVTISFLIVTFGTLSHDHEKFWITFQKPWSHDIVWSTGLGLERSVFLWTSKLKNNKNQGVTKTILPFEDVLSGFIYLLNFCHGQFHYTLRLLIWVVSLQNWDGYQLFSNFEHVGFHVSFSFFFWTWLILFLTTLCKVKWSCHWFLNQWGDSWCGVHGPQSWCT